MSRVYVFLANGFETIEALTVVDMLRRVNIDVYTVSIQESKMVKSSHRVLVESDFILDELDFKDADALILPGGLPGTENLRECEKLRLILQEHNKQGTIIGAICAAPSILGQLGILSGKKACCYPGYEKDLMGAFISKNETETDGNIITSRGMGTSIAFSSAIIDKILSKDESKKLLDKIIYRQSLS
ncbi:MAG: DJ-1/PfpI family protein [Lachnospiraceae bacterium]|nr:DJ-1/PfpI family protein [Lachnospiraceae bacterium]